MFRPNTLTLTLASVVPCGLLLASLPAIAQDGHKDKFKVHPDTFVGRAGECGPGYPAGSQIVTSDWLGGLGLPDNGGGNSNPADPRDNPNKNDSHSGLLLSKNGPTPDCSSAGARITGLAHGATIQELGFDYRNGSHCGAGAPRFNVTTEDGLLYFVGCASGTKAPAPQDPAEWTRVRFGAEDFFPQVAGSPPFQMGVTRVREISIVFDEGTDTPTPEAPSGPGLAVLDNIDINGTLVGDK
jgi:hypothetical protein